MKTKILFAIFIVILSTNIYAQKTEFKPRDSSWWNISLKELKPEILFDFFGDEEWNGGWETGYIVLKKKYKKVILFNTRLLDLSGKEDGGTTYVIYDAKFPSNATRFYFDENLSFLLYNLKSKNIEKILDKIHQKFGGKIIKLNRKDFEKYFS